MTSSLIEYRTFRNNDPPQITALWNEGGLGQGAAEPLTPDAFEIACFSRPYFDRAGLIVAHEGARIVGFAHAGFAVRPDHQNLDFETGVICAVIVHPSFRRQGIGRELVRQAEDYLQSRGVQTIFAGPSPGRDPFYVGIYGGCQPAGFLESDPASTPFFTALGYEIAERHLIYYRENGATNPPVDFRQMAVRRKTQLAVVDGAQKQDWWWNARYGILDSIRFALIPKDSTTPLAIATVVGLDFYFPKLQQRAVGITDIMVIGEDNGNAYDEILLSVVCKRMRQDLVTHLEIHAREDDVHRRKIIEASGFTPADAGTVFRK